jgi:ATP synthase in type III secretion protein N
MIARGTVRAVRGSLVEVDIPALPVGRGVCIEATDAHRLGIVVSVGPGGALVAPHASIEGIVCGDRVVEDDAAERIVLGTAALGRAIGALGVVLDGGAPLRGVRVPVLQPPPPPSLRRAITQPMWTGTKVIDALVTIGKGARVGIFGGPGLGKSSLLERIVRNASADAVVLALVGERGREAQEWIERRDCRTTIVVATSDRAAAERVRAAHVAFAQAQSLAGRGLHVLLVVDSLARFAAAVRELALSAGESVGRGGFPPSVFRELAVLVERAGAFSVGSITLIATVLSDGDERDPVSEAARSLLDGHLQLCARRAQAGSFPAIDVPASVSRTMANVASPGHAEAARRLRGALALLSRASDARSLGIEPLDEPTRRAIAAEDAIERLLRQEAAGVPAERTLAALEETADIL